MPAKKRFSTGAASSASTKGLPSWEAILRGPAQVGKAEGAGAIEAWLGQKCSPCAPSGSSCTARLSFKTGSLGAAEAV